MPELNDELAEPVAPSDAVAPEAPTAPPPPGTWKRLLSNPLAAGSLLVLTLLILTALFAPLLAPHPFDKPFFPDKFAGPSRVHPLGTDDQAYDILSRLIYGTRISLSVALGVETFVVAIGLLVGLTAGYKGGWVETALMRVTDVMLAFPDVLLAILLVGVLGTAAAAPQVSIGLVILALGVTGWPPLARLVRGQVLSLRKREFVEAARALGASDARIILRHILPNLLSPILVAVTVDAAGVILAEATLSFLGIGVQRPYPSWGRMIDDARQFYRSEPRLLFLPSLLLSVTVLSLNFLGDGLRDALDPRSRRR
jgi:ABC-type dipeptide/oligopeptide/nickel transport system permease subunit